MRILPEVLQDDMETRHVVVLTVHILHRNIGGHLGEGLQQLGEGQVIASRRRLHQKYFYDIFPNLKCFDAQRQPFFDTERLLHPQVVSCETVRQ